MYLYYSTNCNHCKRLFATYNFDKFTLIDVEKQNRPSSIHSVPVIVDDDGQIHTGKETFTYMSGLEPVTPYGFALNNLTNHGFSFIDKDPSEMFYCENDKFIELN